MRSKAHPNQVTSLFTSDHGKISFFPYLMRRKRIRRKAPAPRVRLSQKEVRSGLQVPGASSGANPLIITSGREWDDRVEGMVNDITFHCFKHVI